MGGVVTIGIPTYNRSRLLAESMKSVLAQSRGDFVLLISDNASDDDTEAVVASFDDPRIRYSRSATNIGMDPNFNRVLELTETEYVVLLPDDDLLRPDYLEATLELIERSPEVGVVHTAFDIVDGDGEVVDSGRSLLETAEPVAIESGEQFLERSMLSSWTVCWSSALFRTSAIRAAGGLRPEHEPIADFSLLMRIALDWQVAYLNRPVAALRVHPDAYSAQVGTFARAGYTPRDSSPALLREQRSLFLADAALPEDRVRRYRALASAVYRHDTLKALRNRAGVEEDGRGATRELLRLARTDPRILVVGDTWLILGAQLGAKRVKARLGRGHASSNGDGTVG
jgi:glycosyltransferase involved in cell wall biosynthesis